jgi:hypothetical protein
MNIIILPALALLLASATPPPTGTPQNGSPAARSLPSPTPPEPAPAGYVWQPCLSMKAQFLRPKSWHFKEVTKPDTIGCFLSAERIDDTGEFVTGFTVNLMRELPKRKGIVPSVFASQYMRVLAEDNHVLRQSTREQGPFLSFRAEHIDHKTPLPDHHIFTLLLANDHNGSLYLILFESPDAAWQKNWPVAEVILKRMFLDDEM